MANGVLTAYASWNGPTNVAKWQVLEGPNPASIRAVATVMSTGFETTIPVPDPPSRGVVVVHALADDGRVLRSSRAVPIPS
jgi:hypothetical protein